MEHAGVVEREGNIFRCPSLYPMRFCGAMRNELKKVEIHDLWLVACFLYP